MVATIRKLQGAHRSKKVTVTAATRAFKSLQTGKAGGKALYVRRGRSGQVTVSKPNPRAEGRKAVADSGK